MTIKPCHHKILLRVETPEATILVPNKQLNPHNRYFAEAVGPDVTCCKAGDMILLRPNTNEAILAEHIAGDSFHSIIDDSCVFAVLED